MQEKHQKNGTIHLETFEVPEGTLMLLTKAACGVGLELGLVLAEPMNCHSGPTVARGSVLCFPTGISSLL